MKCPGQDTRYWKEDAIFEVECPFCGSAIEFFKDDPVRRCPGCKRNIPNPRMDFGCAAYCKYADICLGEITSELLLKNVNLLKERVKKMVLQRLKDSEQKKDFLKEVEKIEATLKKEDSSVGLKLLSRLLKVLSKEQRKEIYKELNIPEILIEEIEEVLTD